MSFRQKLCSRPQVKDTKSMQMISTTHSSSYAINCKVCVVGDHKHSFLSWSPGLALTVNWQFMKPKTQINCVPVWLGSLTTGTFSSLATFFYSCWPWKISNNTTFFYTCISHTNSIPVYYVQKAKFLVKENRYMWVLSVVYERHFWKETLASLNPCLNGGYFERE